MMRSGGTSVVLGSGRLIRGVGQLLCVIVPFMVQEADDLLLEVIDGRFTLNLGMMGSGGDLRCSWRWEAPPCSS